MNTYERLRRCVAEELSIDEATIRPHTPLTSSRGGHQGPNPPRPPQGPASPADPEGLWNPEEDSLEFVELTMRLEEEFALELSDADAERFASMTLAELAAEIDRLRRLGVERGSDTEGEAA